MASRSECKHDKGFTWNDIRFGGSLGPRGEIAWSEKQCIECGIIMVYDKDGKRKN